MYKSILLTVDLAHDASWEKALPQACDLVRASGGNLHILGIVHELGSAMVASYLPKDFERAAISDLKSALDEFAAAHVPSDVKAETHVGHGHVAEVILKTAGDLGSDLIVMASHPPDELRNFLVGSNAGKVVRHSHIPVLVVR